MELEDLPDEIIIDEIVPKLSLSELLSYNVSSKKYNKLLSEIIRDRKSGITESKIIISSNSVVILRSRRILYYHSTDPLIASHLKQIKDEEIELLNLDPFFYRIYRKEEYYYDERYETKAKQLVEAFLSQFGWRVLEQFERLIIGGGYLILGGNNLYYGEFSRSNENIIKPIEFLIRKRVRKVIPNDEDSDESELSVETEEDLSNLIEKFYLYYDRKDTPKLFLNIDGYIYSCEDFRPHDGITTYYLTKMSPASFLLWTHLIPVEFEHYLLKWCFFRRNPSDYDIELKEKELDEVYYKGDQYNSYGYAVDRRKGDIYYLDSNPYSQQDKIIRFSLGKKVKRVVIVNQLIKMILITFDGEVYLIEPMKDTVTGKLIYKY